MPTSEVIFKAKDTGAATVKAATENLKRMAAQKKVLNEQTRVLTGTFNQFGNLLGNTFGGTLGGVANIIESVVISNRKMEAGMRTSAAALLGMAAAGAAVGASLGGEIYDLLNIRLDEIKKDQLSFAKILSDAQMERLAIVNSEAAAQLKINMAIDDRAQALIKMKHLSPQQFSQGADALNSLREANRISQVQKADASILESKMKANATYKEAMQSISDFENRQRREDFDKEMTVLDQKIEAIQRYNAMEYDGAIGRTELENELRLNTLEGIDLVKAQNEIAYQERMRQIATLTITEEQAIALIEKANEERRKKEKKQALQSASDQLYAYGALLGNLAQLSATFGKKSFGLTQALRYAEAVVNTAAAITNALASPAPWPIPLIYAAAAGAAGAAQIAVIAGTKKPQAHSGLDYVPQEATYKLQRGEMVLDPGTSEEVRQAAIGGGGGGNYVVNIQLDGAVLARGIGQMSRDGRLTISARAIA